MNVHFESMSEGSPGNGSINGDEADEQNTHDTAADAAR
jgi:hypothetical protein